MKKFNVMKKQKGATMVEYAIMVALIAIVSILVVTSLGQTVKTSFSTVNTAFE